MWLLRVFADSQLRATDKIIAWAISYFLNRESWQAFPSHKKLARMCGVSVRTSEYATGNLERAGYLAISRKANCSNTYEMSLPQETGVGTADFAVGVPQPVAGGTATSCGSVPQHVAPEPLIEPLIEPLKSSGAKNETEDKESGERAPMGPSEADLSYEAYELVASHCSATQPEILDRRLRRKFPAAAERLAQLQACIAAGKDIEGLAAEAA
jgi:hypothetical protein